MFCLSGGPDRFAALFIILLRTDESCCVVYRWQSKSRGSWPGRTWRVESYFIRRCFSPIRDPSQYRHRVFSWLATRFCISRHWSSFRRHETSYGCPEHLILHSSRRQRLYSDQKVVSTGPRECKCKINQWENYRVEPLLSDPLLTGHSYQAASNQSPNGVFSIVFTLKCYHLPH